MLETAYPEPPKPKPTPAEQLLPKTMAKLRSGERLRILAWGDSVTVGTYVPDWEHNRWQEQFVARLKARFPRANIELLTEAWGGRNTASYLAEPPGSPHNYQEKVLAPKPDLIVSEFVNDAGLNPAQVNERYGKLLADFQGIGAEWIILTPHYVRPDWMGLNREREVDDDPRPYVAGLREFAARNQDGPGRRLPPLRTALAAGHPLQHAHAQFHQPSRRARHEAVRRRADGTLPLSRVPMLKANAYSPAIGKSARWRMHAPLLE